MCGSMVDIQCAAAEIRRGKKKIDRKKPHDENIMVCSIPLGDHNKRHRLVVILQSRLTVFYVALGTHYPCPQATCSRTMKTDVKK